MEPCWPQFPPKWGGAVERRPLFCWVYVAFRFWGCPGPLLVQLGSILEGLGLDFEGFWAPFWRFPGHDLGPILSWRHVGSSWDGFGNLHDKAIMNFPSLSNVNRLNAFSLNLARRNARSD